MLLNDVCFACEVWFCYRVLENFTVNVTVSVSSTSCVCNVSSCGRSIWSAVDKMHIKKVFTEETVNKVAARVYSLDFELFDFLYL
jgi:hypothetical protein